MKLLIENLVITPQAKLTSDEANCKSGFNSMRVKTNEGKLFILCLHVKVVCITCAMCSYVLGACIAAWWRLRYFPVWLLARPAQGWLVYFTGVWGEVGLTFCRNNKGGKPGREKKPPRGLIFYS